VRIELGVDPFLGDVFIFVGKDRARDVEHQRSDLDRIR
jgi:hypothetical protein